MAARVRIMMVACFLLLPACGWDGHFTALGYTTRPNYDTCIHTVHVPIFRNVTLRRGLEFDLTKAVVREIGLKTPYRVVSNPAEADTELTGTIISLNKNILNRNQLNEVREAETTLAVEVVWKNLRTGEILSQPRPASGPNVSIPTMAPANGMPDQIPPPPVGGIESGLAPPPPPPPGAPPPPPPPVLIQSIGGFIPELGESITTAQQQNVNRLAVQIVSMMEKPW